MKTIIIVGIVVAFIVIHTILLTKKANPIKKEKSKFTKTLELIGVIFLCVGVLLSPLPYLYMYDNYERFKVIIMIVGFVGYYLILVSLFIYYFNRPVWDKFVGKK